MKRLVAYSAVQSATLGVFWTIELTVSEKAGVAYAHVHVHALVAIDPAVYRGEQYIHQRVWCKLWGRAAKLSYTPICWVSAVRDRDGAVDRWAVASGLVELAKYLIKPSADLYLQDGGGFTVKPGVALALYQALKHQRMNGDDQRLFKEARRRLKAQAAQKPHSGHGPSETPPPGGRREPA